MLLTQVGPDRVSITGVTGTPPSPTTKLAVTAPGGHESAVSFDQVGAERFIAPLTGLFLPGYPGLYVTPHKVAAPVVEYWPALLGEYQGVTEQVTMSRTPGAHDPVLIPRGASPREWISSL